MPGLWRHLMALLEIGEKKGFNFTAEDFFRIYALRPSSSGRWIAKVASESIDPIFNTANAYDRGWGKIYFFVKRSSLDDPEIGKYLRENWVKDPTVPKPKHCRSEGLEFLKSIPVIERKFNAKGKGPGIGADFCEGSKPEENSSEEKSEKKKRTPSIELIHPGSHSSGPRNDFTDTMSTASQAVVTAKKVPTTTDLIARRKRRLKMIPSDETSTKEGLSPAAAKKPPTPVSTTIQDILSVTKTDDPQKPPAPDTPSLLLPITKVKYGGDKGTAALEDACYYAFQVMQSVLFLREQGSEEERATVALVRERDSLTEKIKTLGQELKQVRVSFDKEKASSDVLLKRVCELEQENSELGTKSVGLEEKNAA